MSVESEYQLEERLISQLTQSGYQYINIHTEEEMIQNFRQQLNRHNRAELAGVDLSDREFNIILQRFTGKTVFDLAKILRNKQDLKRDNGEKIYLELFNSTEWCRNIYQVTNQITVDGKYENRYDVTILVNGLPLAQIELKRRGGDLHEAFHQITRYRQHSYEYSKLFRFVQIFIISNGTDTKYLGNSNKDLSLDFAFYWTDEKNNRVNRLEHFAQDFLHPCHISKMIARYTVLHEKHKTLMVMRPYQVYAVEAIINQAKNTNSNGYIWHATGSGKTLTSFKASQILRYEQGIDQVFFLVDRRDLDKQTIDEFNKFSEDSIDTTENTRTLVKQMKDASQKLIITTIQKLSKAVKNYETDLSVFKDKKVVFIIDECHRSQFGDMHRVIAKHFQNAQYFGFTGTPRFEKNKSQDGRATADIFGVRLHQYLIKDAIKDHNVLGFNIEYYKTLDQAEERILNDEKAPEINKEEVINHPERISKVVKCIIDNHDKKTKNRNFNAIFTVNSGNSGVPLLKKYYDELQLQNQRLSTPLKIAAIFSFGANAPLIKEEGILGHHRDILEKIILDYNRQFNETLSTDTWKEYFDAIVKKVKNGEIDLLLVVDMFLTGFDAPKLNTLYVDRNLQYHGLVQAYSRTNRISEAKAWGNIVCFRNLKPNTDEALKLFSDGESPDEFLIKPMTEYIGDFKTVWLELKQLVPTVYDIDKLEKEDDIIHFIKLFREILRLLVKLETFIDFSYDMIETSEQEIADYTGKYKTIAYETERKRSLEKVSILDDINFELELTRVDKVNVQYILNLIYDLDRSDKETMNKDIKQIIRELQTASDQQLRNKAELIQQFLEQFVPHLDEEEDIQVAFEDFQQSKKTEYVYEIANEFNLAENRVTYHINEMIYSGELVKDELNNDIHGTFQERREKKRYFQEKVEQFVAIFE